MYDYKTRKFVLKEVDKLWPKLIRENYKNQGSLIGLPYQYVVPAVRKHEAFHFDEQYYWDSYFIALGLIETGYHSLAEGMLENLIFLFKEYGIIPNASRTYMTGHSQPPLLSSYIMLVYEKCSKNKQWLINRMNIAIAEYTEIWTSKHHPNWRNVYKGLSRYYDINVLHDLAEVESGWDMSPRFDRNCLDYLPIDLNCLLYKYECDFAKYFDIIGDSDNSKKWLRIARKRQKAINSLMWSESNGFYFDYNYSQETIDDIWSLAGYYAMWLKVATPEQARKMVKNLKIFEKKGGLTTTSRSLLELMPLFGSQKTQWSYPNGWAPLQLIVIEGLRNYGYYQEADRISNKWIKTCLDWYLEHGEFLEKYNVVNPKQPPQNGVYPNQAGFGWTNSVLIMLVNQNE